MIKIPPPQRLAKPKFHYQKGQPRHQERAALAQQIKDSIEPSSQREQIEDAVKYRDFERYHKLTGNTGHPDKVLIGRVLQAIDVIKQGLHDAYDKSLSYDPTMNVVQDIQSTSEDLLKQLDTQTTKLLKLRANLAEMTDADRRKLNTIDRDVERWSDKLSQIKVQADKLDTYQKLSPDEVERIKDAKKAKSSSNALTNAIQELFRYGPNPVNLKTIEDAIDDPPSASIISSAIKKELTRYDDSILNLRKLISRTSTLRDKLEINFGKMNVPEQTTFNDLKKTMNPLLVEVQKYINDLISPRHATMQTVHEYSKAKEELDLFTSEFETYLTMMQTIWSTIPNPITSEPEDMEDMFRALKTINDDIDMIIPALRVFYQKFTDMLAAKNRTNHHIYPARTPMSKEHQGLNLTKNPVTGKRLKYLTQNASGTVEEELQISRGKTADLRNMLSAYALLANETEVEMDSLRSRIRKALEKTKEGLKDGSIKGATAYLHRATKKALDDIDDGSRMIDLFVIFDDAVTQYVRSIGRKPVKPAKLNPNTPRKPTSWARITTPQKQIPLPPSPLSGPSLPLPTTPLSAPPPPSRPAAVPVPIPPQPARPNWVSPSKMSQKQRKKRGVSKATPLSSFLSSP